MRTLLACACLAAARYVPFLAYFMSLIGSFLTIAVSVVLPISLHLKIFQVCLLCSKAGLPRHASPGWLTLSRLACFAAYAMGSKSV